MNNAQPTGGLNLLEILRAVDGLGLRYVRSRAAALTAVAIATSLLAAAACGEAPALWLGKSHTGMSVSRARARVDLAGGPVTLEPLEQLTARRDFLRAQVTHATIELQQLNSSSQEMSRQAGSMLAADRAGWDSSGMKQDLACFDSLTAQVQEADAALADLTNRRGRGLGGLVKRLGARGNRLAVLKQRERLDAQLGGCLQDLARRAPERTVPEADHVLGMLRGLWNRSAAVRQQKQAAEAELLQIDDEIQRRREAISRLGFDALWTAAWLQSNEPPAIESPVQLKRAEAAWLSVPATLSRPTTQTHWTGSSHGVSFPIGHTGIRYRVGSFRGQPVEATVIKNVDSGTLVLTNQRLVFVGRLHSVVIALGRVVHVEAYTDALGVFQDSRQSPDFFRLTTPQNMLFYLNYALSRLQ
jgi:hypothetical protein